MHQYDNGAWNAPYVVIAALKNLCAPIRLLRLVSKAGMKILRLPAFQKQVNMPDGLYEWPDASNIIAPL